MKIRVSFWSGLGGQSPTLGNVRGFQQFGDVEYIPCELIQKRHLDKGADLFFTPDTVLMQKTDPAIFTILQMGGVGAGATWESGGFVDLHKVTEHAEVVTILDTNMYHFLLAKKQPWEWSKVFLVPNGLHYDMFKPEKRQHKIFTVLMGKVGAIGKIGFKIVKVGRLLKKKGYKNKIRIAAPVQMSYLISPDWYPLEPRPFYKMPELYQEADIFLNVPEREVLPNSVFEAFQTGLPVVVSGKTAMARLQTVPTKFVEKMRKDFGTPVDYFDEVWKSLYETGDHYIRCKTLDEVVEKIILLYEHPDLQMKLGEKGREWSSKLNWTWKTKCQLLLDLATNAGFKYD